VRHLAQDGVPPRTASPAVEIDGGDDRRRDRPEPLTPPVRQLGGLQLSTQALRAARAPSDNRDECVPSEGGASAAAILAPPMDETPQSSAAGTSLPHPWGMERLANRDVVPLRCRNRAEPDSAPRDAPQPLLPDEAGDRVRRVPRPSGTNRSLAAARMRPTAASWNFQSHRQTKRATG
jgi:hypothetical protein